MRPLFSSQQSLELDAYVRQMFDYSDEMLMEIAAGKLWEALKTEILPEIDAQCGKLPGGQRSGQISIAAVCGKGDNAGDGLVILRHAWLEGCRECVAYIPSGKDLKEAARKNLARAERCGIVVHQYGDDAYDAATLAGELEQYDVVLDAVLGTGTRGPARSHAALAIEALNETSRLRAKNAKACPFIVAVDVPSGLSDAWQQEYPIVRADATLAIEPMKEALYQYAARPHAGKIVPVGGIFPLWTEKSTSQVFLVEESDMDRYLPPVSIWAHKMQRGKVALLAGSEAGAGAALHCVRGALAAGAGYVALYCDEALFPSFLATAGDAAIVRVYSEEDFSPETWDAVVVGPGWGTDTRRRETLTRLLRGSTPLILDADAVHIYTVVAGERMQKGQSIASGIVVLTPHPGEFRELLPLIDVEDESKEPDASKSVRQTSMLAKKLHAIVALRASTTHVVEPSGNCAIFDGSAFGLGIAGSGDVLAGLAGGLLARRIAQLHEELRPSDIKADFLLEEAAKAIVGAVVVHGAAGARLSQRRGWFNPVELSQECASITSKRYQGEKECSR